jgi:hypothetical protein
VTLLWWVLGVLAAAAISEELLGWVDTICRVVLRRGARRLPGEWRARYAEEWEAELLATPGGPITKIVWTLRTRFAVRAIAAVRTASQPPLVEAAKSSPDGARIGRLVDRARDGDVKAFGDLYDEYALTVYRYLYERTSSNDLAEDLTAETFVRAVRGLDTCRGPDFSAWLTVIAQNVVAERR